MFTFSPTSTSLPWLLKSLKENVILSVNHKASNWYFKELWIFFLFGNLLVILCFTQLCFVFCIGGKEGGWRCLWTIDGVTPGTLPSKYSNAAGTLSCWLLVWGRTICRGNFNTQPVMSSAPRSTGCRLRALRPSYWSLGTLTMPLCPPLCPNSPSMCHQRQ